MSRALLAALLAAALAPSAGARMNAATLLQKTVAGVTATPKLNLAFRAQADRLRELSLDSPAKLKLALPRTDAGRLALALAARPDLTEKLRDSDPALFNDQGLYHVHAAGAAFAAYAEEHPASRMARRLKTIAERLDLSKLKGVQDFHESFAEAFDEQRKADAAALAERKRAEAAERRALEAERKELRHLVYSNPDRYTAEYRMEFVRKSKLPYHERKEMATSLLTFGTSMVASNIGSHEISRLAETVLQGGDMNRQIDDFRRDWSRRQRRAAERREEFYRSSR